MAQCKHVLRDSLIIIIENSSCAGGVGLMPLWVRPAAASRASDTARQARFRKAVCAGGPHAPACPQQRARTYAFHRQPRSTGVWARTGLGAGGAERSTAQELGAPRHAETQVSAVCAQTAGHQAGPPAGPRSRVEGGEGYFRGSSRGVGTPCPGASWGERRVPGSERGPRRF